MLRPFLMEHGRCIRTELISQCTACLVQRTSHDPLTVDKVLLLRRDDADQVGVDVPAALLGVQPRLSVRDMQVAVALKLGPTLLTLLLICSSNTKESTLNAEAEPSEFTFTEMCLIV